MTGNETLKEIFDNCTTEELLQLYKEWQLQKETGLSKSPEDIMKGLECCVSNVGCRECPYKDRDFVGCDSDALTKDALTYIKQLRAKLEEKNG